MDTGPCIMPFLSYISTLSLGSFPSQQHKISSKTLLVITQICALGLEFPESNAAFIHCMPPACRIQSEPLSMAYLLLHDRGSTRSSTPLLTLQKPTLYSAASCVPCSFMPLATSSPADLTWLYYTIFKLANYYSRKLF